MTYAMDTAGGSDSATVARGYGTAFNGTPAVNPNALTATGTGAAFDARADVVSFDSPSMYANSQKRWDTLTRHSTLVWSFDYAGACVAMLIQYRDAFLG